jgi:alkylhydroperoxidase family enzyme
MILWAWSSTAPGVTGAGVSGDEERAAQAAVEWMTAHGAARALLEQVRTALASDLTDGYMRTGARMAAVRHRNGDVTWIPA